MFFGNSFFSFCGKVLSLWCSRCWRHSFFVFSVCFVGFSAGPCCCCLPLYNVLGELIFTEMLLLMIHVFFIAQVFWERHKLVVFMMLEAIPVVCFRFADVIRCLVWLLILPYFLFPLDCGFLSLLSVGSKFSSVQLYSSGFRLLHKRAL